MKQEKKNLNWKKMFFIILVILIIVFVFIIIKKQNSLNSQPEGRLEICSQIRGTPAWVQNGQIIGYGYGFPENYAKQSFNDVVNDYLIPNKISFVWDAKCIHCQRQIQDWGEEAWQDYQDNGFTIECNLL